MTVALPPALSDLVAHFVATGRYADEGEVVREALRALERQEFEESPALEAALLEGDRSPHRSYGPEILASVRTAAAAVQQ